MNAVAEAPRPVVREYTPDELTQIGRQLPERVVGPRAFSGSLRKFLALTWMLAYLEFKLKFFGSVLGYAWQLVRPLMVFGILYVVFTQVIRIGGEVNYYPVVLLSAIVVFSFFSESTVGAVSSVVGREGLIRKISFPIIAAPIATVTSVLLTLGLNYLVVLVFALASGVEPTWRWIQILPLLGLLYLVSISIGVALSALYVRFRDVMPIWEVLAQVLFYATPVIYTIEFVQDQSATLSKVMMCNPVTAIIQQIRHAAIDPTSPSVVDVLGNWHLLAIPMGLVGVLTAVGLVTMNRMAPRLAEEL